MRAPAAEPFGRQMPDRQSFAAYVALLEFVAQRRLSAEEQVYLRDDLRTQFAHDPVSSRRVLGWVERSLLRIRSTRDPLTRLMLHEGLRVMTYCALAEAPPAAPPARSTNSMTVPAIKATAAAGNRRLPFPLIRSLLFGASHLWVPTA